MTDVLALATKVARVLDPIAAESRATVLRILCDRYQLGPMAGAARSRKWRDDDNVTAVTRQTSLDGELGSPAPPPAFPVFQIPESIRTALKKTTKLGGAVTLQRPSWWQAEIRANPSVDFAAEVLKAEAWIVANPARAPKRDYSRFLHNWFGRATERAAE